MRALAINNREMRMGQYGMVVLVAGGRRGGRARAGGGLLYYMKFH